MKTLSIFAVVVAAPLIHADDFEIPFGQPIPKEVWRIRENPAAGIYDAVILVDRTQFSRNRIQRFRRIRILSENGKSAADLNLSGGVKKLRGRVVDITGEETRFEKKEDLVEFLVSKRLGSRQSRKAKILAPPGLTVDCVVEASWETPSAAGLPLNSSGEEYFVQEDFFCREKSFVITDGARVGDNPFFITQFTWSQPGDSDQFRKTRKDDVLTISYRNVKPSQTFPFGQPSMDANAFRFSTFRTFGEFRRQPNQFWADYCKLYLKKLLFEQPMHRTAKYKKWVKALKAKLPGDPLNDLMFVYNEFRKRIHSADLLSPALRRSLAEGAEAFRDERVIPQKAFELNFCPTAYMGLLFYAVAKDAGLEFLLVLPRSIYDPPFAPNAMQPFALSYYTPLFAVTAPNGSLVTVCPSFPEYDAAYGPPAWQGSSAMIVDPFDKWSHRFAQLPRFGPDLHTLVRQCRMSLDGSGELRFETVQKGSGAFNAEARATYYPLTAAEQRETLRRTWSRGSSLWEITHAEVVNGSSFEGQVESKVSGRRVIDLADSDWLSIYPFPGDTLPIATPNRWPPNRSQPIILPHCVNQVDLVKIALPPNWTLRGDPNWRKSNEVGEVRFGAVQKGSELTVRRDIVIKRDLLSADKERDLKFFIAWMEEAYYQSIGIVKGGG